MSRQRVAWDWVIVRLEYWGRWSARNTDGLGYASRTQEGRLMDEGPVGSKTNYRDHSPNVEFAHKEHETDRAVNAIPDGLMRNIIKRRHVDCKGWEQIADQFGMSQSRVRQLHDQALAFLASEIPHQKIVGVVLTTPNVNNQPTFPGSLDSAARKST